MHNDTIVILHPAPRNPARFALIIRLEVSGYGTVNHDAGIPLIQESFMRLRDLVPMVVLMAVFGCGGGGGGGGGNPVSVSVSPPSANLTPGGTQQFTATVTNAANTAVTWSVDSQNGGTITQAGLYTAPGAAGTYTVRATSVQDPTKSDTSSVTVAANVAVTVNPPNATLSVGDPQTFTAVVQGTANQSVSWSVQEGAAGGSISATGVYTAPGVPGTYHVVATSQADPSKSGSATVIVQAGNAAGTIQ